MAKTGWGKLCQGGCNQTLNTWGNYRHSIIEVGSNLWRSPSPSSVLKAGSARAGCSGLCPFWALNSSRDEEFTAFPGLGCFHSKKGSSLWLKGIFDVSVCALCLFWLNTSVKSLALCSLPTLIIRYWYSLIRFTPFSTPSLLCWWLKSLLESMGWGIAVGGCTGVIGQMLVV